jgi:hypothetical protein
MAVVRSSAGHKGMPGGPAFNPLDPPLLLRRIIPAEAGIQREVKPADAVSILVFNPL